MYIIKRESNNGIITGNQINLQNIWHILLFIFNFFTFFSVTRATGQGSIHSRPHLAMFEGLQGYTWQSAGGHMALAPEIKPR